MRTRMFGLLPLALLWIASPASARWGMPEPLTERGVIVEEIYSQIMVAGLIVFAIVFAWLVIVLWRFRAHTGHGRSTHEHERENLKAELGWTIIPLMIVLWVGWIGYVGLLELDEGYSEEEAYTEIHVVGVRYSWTAHYGDGVRVTSSFDPADPDNMVPIIVPADRPVRINLTADENDILHAMNILDANRAYVWISDANPIGAYKYNHGTIVFPEGKYLIQCKEHCFNPGHAYMKGRIEAVPVAEYEEWLEVKRLEAGASLLSHIDVNVADGAITTDADLSAVKGTRFIVKASNTLGEAVTLTAPGAQVTLPAGATQYFAINAPEPGQLTLSSTAGGNLTFTILDAEVFRVELNEYNIIPKLMRMEAGKTYLVQVENTGAQGHNLFIGTLNDGTSLVEWKSVDIAGGDTASFVMTPETAMTWDTWCNIPGHVGLGMVGTATVR